MTTNGDPADETPGAGGDTPEESSPVETQPSTQEAEQSSPEPVGQSPPPVDGQAPPPVGGTQSSTVPLRRVNKGRIITVVVVLLIITGGTGAVVLGGGLPSLPTLPSFGECSADAPDVAFVSYQSTGPDGERVALQLTHIENTEYVAVVDGDTEVANMTGVGNTTTVTGLSAGETVEYMGETKCGILSVGNYTVG